MLKKYIIGTFDGDLFHFDVACWHEPDLERCPQFGRYPGKPDVARIAQLGRDDPTATLVVHRGNGFDAGFRPYQSARLSRYNAGPQSSLVSIVGRSYKGTSNNCRGRQSRASLG